MYSVVPYFLRKRVRKYLDNEPISKCFEECVWTKKWSHIQSKHAYKYYVPLKSPRKQALSISLSANSIKHFTRPLCIFAQWYLWSA